MNGKIRAVMIFCEVPSDVALWWAELLSVNSGIVNDDDGFSWFESGDTEYGFHPADPERNPLGGSPVVYLATPDLQRAMERAITLGATRHRGPLVDSSDRSIAQFVDPYGNVFGIDGPSN
jgi:predicted enzyme related to lactoylglutathione lyase